jgi:hypothetical protein
MMRKKRKDKVFDLVRQTPWPYLICMVCVEEMRSGINGLVDNKVEKLQLFS